MEVANSVTRLDWRSDPGCKYESRFLPRISSELAFAFLVLAVTLKCFNCELRERNQAAFAYLRIGAQHEPRFLLALAGGGFSYSLEIRADGDHPGHSVDITPCECQSFAPPKPYRECD